MKIIIVFTERNKIKNLFLNKALIVLSIIIILIIIMWDENLITSTFFYNPSNFEKCWLRH